MKQLRPIDKEIFRLALPALAALSAESLYSLFDTAFVGHLGVNELGAVAVGSTAFTASFWMFSFLAFGVTPKVARAAGAGDLETADRLAVNALGLAIAIGIPVTLIGFFGAGTIVSAIGAEGAVAPMAETYLQIRALSIAPGLVILVGSGWLRGLHLAKIAGVIMSVGIGGNVVLDYILIFPAGLGTAGAALAHVIGQTAVAAAFVVVIVRRTDPSRWSIDGPTMRSLLRVGADLIVRSGSLVAGFTVATAVATRMGVLELGAWQVAMQVFLFLALTLDSVAFAAQSIIGQRLGAKLPHEAIGAGHRLIVWGLVAGGVMAAVVLPFADPISRLFSDNDAVIRGARGLLIWLALVLPLSALTFTLDGILIGASDTRFIAKAMVAASAVYIVLSIGALRMSWGTAGLAVSTTAFLLVRSALLGGRLLRKGWAV